MISIRLKRTGTKNRKQWRIVVADHRVSRAGSFLETLGFYDPHLEPPKIQIHQERYMAWIGKGARPTPIVQSLARRLFKPHAH